MNADLWPHIWAFRAWAAMVSAVCPGIDPFNPHAILEAMEK
jgi:hypothetical protein